MSENIKIKSTTTNGASHAFEFRGRIKWPAIGLLVIVVTAFAAITFISRSAIQQCSAPCYMEISRKQIILAPAGESVALEHRLTGTIATPRHNLVAPLPATSIAPASVATLEETKPVNATARQAQSKPATTKTMKAANAAPARKPPPKRPPTLTQSPPASEHLHRVIWQTIDRS